MILRLWLLAMFVVAAAFPARYCVTGRYAPETVIGKITLGLAAFVWGCGVFAFATLFVSIIVAGAWFILTGHLPQWFGGESPWDFLTK